MDNQTKKTLEIIIFIAQLLLMSVPMAQAVSAASTNFQISEEEVWVAWNSRK